MNKCILLLIFFTITAFTDTIVPSSFYTTMAIGDDTTIEKTVTITKGNPTSAKIDIFFLTDATGSMSSFLDTVKTNSTAIIDSTSSFGDVAYGVGSYRHFRDTGFNPGYTFKIECNITKDTTIVKKAIDTLKIGGGGGAEDNLFALFKTSEIAGWRTNSTRIIVWFGDIDGRDPSYDGTGTWNDTVTLAMAIDALREENINVEAISVKTTNPGLKDQAKTIADSTNGHFYPNFDMSQIVTQIKNAIDTVFYDYNKVSLIDSGATPGVTVTIDPLEYNGVWNRSKDEIFNFDVTFTKNDTLSAYFVVNALVDGGIVASEYDTINALVQNKPPTADPVSVTNIYSWSPVIHWTYADPNGDPQVQYEVEVYDGAGGTGNQLWNPVPVTDETASSCVYAGALLTKGQTYYARVRVHDGDLWSIWAESPVILSDLIQDTTFSILENSLPGTIVGQINMMLLDSITFNLLDVVPEFILSTTGLLTVSSPAILDYETTQSYSFQVITQDTVTIGPNCDTAIVTVNVLDEIIGDLITDQGFIIDENSPSGTIVCTLALNVPDTIPVTLSLLPGAPTEFNLDLSTKILTVSNTAILDYETQQSYVLYVCAQASEAKNDTAVITITITDQDWGDLISNQSFSIIANTPAGKIIGTIPLNVPDSLDVFELPNPPFISQAFIFDNTGNGIGDSVNIIFETPMDTFVPHNTIIQWPENNTPITVPITTDNIVNMTKVCLPFVPDASAPIVTDSIGDISVNYDSLGTTVIRSARLLDKIGPLLKSAQITERFFPGPDSIVISFTEKVNTPDITGQSFILIKNKGLANEKEVVLEITDNVIDQGDQRSISLEIADLNKDAPQEGDFLKILSTGPVTDTSGNHAHLMNTPVVLKLISRPIPVDSAFYFDKDGNGVVETIHMYFRKYVSNLTILKSLIVWEEDSASA